MSDTKRPSHYDERIDLEVAGALLPKVLRWLKARGEDEPTEEDRQDILEQLANACRFHDDGYEVAKQLDDRHMWESDSELVDLLDEVAFARIRAHEKAVEAWVQQHGVAPKYSVGQRVAFKRQRWDKEKVTGEVTAVREKTAQYLVFCESLGHVREGCGTHGTYVAFEDAEAA